MFYIASEIEMTDNIKHRMPDSLRKTDELMSVVFISAIIVPVNVLIKEVVHLTQSSEGAGSMRGGI